MQTRRAAREEAAAIESVSAHAVLLSEDLVCQQLWRWLDADAKAALRVMNKRMRSLVDGAVQVVASPSSGASANDLASALLRWPAVRILTLLGVSGATDLSPLSTASLAGLTSLTVSQEVTYPRAWDIPAPSSSVAATLQVVDISGCYHLRSIDCVRSCVKLRCLWMSRCDNVTDLSPLGAYSETLEELWMGDSDSIISLAPLAACPRLRKLDLRNCRSELISQAEGLACTQLTDPSTVKIEGLVHELQSNMPLGIKGAAANALGNMAYRGAEIQTAIVAAGAIPPLLRLLGHNSSDVLLAAVASTLSILALEHDANQAAMTVAGTVPAPERLYKSCSHGVRVAASEALRSVGGFD
ncbi:hypothetical protein FOA52_011123 [Chlamydomonas sp. UWO 241]|nr:hypothetical protein FOA52_011123 [Chlamydomonas sp. UWO 241]